MPEEARRDLGVYEYALLSFFYSAKARTQSDWTYQNLGAECHMSRARAFSAARSLESAGWLKRTSQAAADGGCLACQFALARPVNLKNRTPVYHVEAPVAGPEEKNLAGASTEKQGGLSPGGRGGCHQVDTKELREVQDQELERADQTSLVGDANPSPTTHQRTPKKARTYAPDSREFRLALDLRNRVRENWPTIKLPDDDHLDPWADGVRKMLELDGRTEEEVAGLIAWATRDSFWSQNIRSAASLRDHWDALEVKRQSQAKAQAARARTATLRQPVFELGGEAAYDPQLEGSAAND